MRLYLSSFRLGLYPAELVRLAGGKNAKTLFIANAADCIDPSNRTATVRHELSDLRGIGLDASELDLREFFGKANALSEVLTGVDLLWVRGGNTFVLRRAMAASGFDELVTPMVRSGAVAYGGYSAGFCVLSPSLQGLEIVDNPHDIPDGYLSDVIWEGLGLISYAVAPHYKSLHPESADVSIEVAFYEQHAINYRKFHDGEVVIVDGEKEVTLGFEHWLGPVS